MVEKTEEKFKRTKISFVVDINLRFEISGCTDVMDFSCTPHVRIHTEISDTGRYLGFFGRCLLDQFMKACNLAGVLILSSDFQDDLPAAVAVAIDCPDPDWVREHLPRLLERKVIVLTDDKKALVMPRYLAGQYGGVKNVLSRKLSVQRVRDLEEAETNGWYAKEFLSEAAEKGWLPKGYLNTLTEVGS